MFEATTRTCSAPTERRVAHGVCPIIAVVCRLPRWTTRVRDNPGRVLAAEADWIGTSVIEAVLSGGARAEPAVSAYRTALYWGRRVCCPVCNGHFRHFKPAWNRPDAICPGCQSQERHRALWLYLSDGSDLLDGVESLLHFAPEPRLEQHLRQRVSQYVSADLDSPKAMDHADIMALPYERDSFDAIVCSHVLEHVEDDRRAIREMLRVLRPKGWALIMVPVDLSATATLEDRNVVTPEARKAAYRQEDHVRLYGTDLPGRLDSEGFETTVIPYARLLVPPVRRRFGLNQEDEFYLARKPGKPAGAGVQEAAPENRT